MKRVNKYNNGKPSNIKNINEQDVKVAVKEWAEGNKNLEDAIMSCIENEIPTYSSCSGHRWGEGYITVIITDSNYRRVLNIMNEIVKEKTCAMSLDYIRPKNEKENDNESLSTLTVYAQKGKQDKTFDIVNRASNKKVDLTEVEETVKELWEYHSIMKERGVYGYIEYEKKNFGKQAIMWFDSSENKEYEDKIVETGAKPVAYVDRTYVVKKDVVNTLKKINDEIVFIGRENFKERRDEFKDKFKKTLTYQIYYANQENSMNNGKEKQGKNKIKKNNSKGKEPIDD